MNTVPFLCLYKIKEPSKMTNYQTRKVSIILDCYVRFTDLMDSVNVSYLYDRSSLLKYVSESSHHGTLENTNMSVE